MSLVNLWFWVVEHPPAIDRSVHVLATCSWQLQICRNLRQMLEVNGAKQMAAHPKSISASLHMTKQKILRSRGFPHNFSKQNAARWLCLQVAWELHVLQRLLSCVSLSNICCCVKNQQGIYLKTKRKKSSWHDRCTAWPVLHRKPSSARCQNLIHNGP